jgi:exoribonuclease-2
VADPSAFIGKDSAVETEARGRGATLYIPEGSFRMLSDEILPFYALGLAETSPALTFKMSLNSSGEIEATEIFPSIVKVKQLTYRETDEIIADGNGPEAALLRDIDGLAQRNFKRRLVSGAIHLEMPETHISLINGQVSIEPIVRYHSADLVRECMLLAGEGAGIWALQRNVPIPYIEQETGDIPAEILPGMAGAFQLRRCMRPRLLSVKPGLHQGLGMNTYTQVTSPLRRYTDLLAHIQIRAFLQNAGPLSADEVAARMIAGEAAAVAVAQAERASRSHWTAVFLSGKKGSSWEAVALEKKGNRLTLAIPALALETQVPLRNDPAPNDTLRLILK